MARCAESSGGQFRPKAMLLRAMQMLVVGVRVTHTLADLYARASVGNSVWLLRRGRTGQENDGGLCCGPL